MASSHAALTCLRADLYGQLEVKISSEQMSQPKDCSGKEPTERRNFCDTESFQIPKDLQEVDERETTK